MSWRKEKRLKSELSNVLNPKRMDEQKVANYQVPTFMKEKKVYFSFYAAMKWL